MKLLSNISFLSVLLAVNISIGNRAFAESGSESTSCSGQIKLCEDGLDTCSSRSFYIYSYQYVYIYDGKIQSENHNLNITGFLDDNYRLIGLSEKWVIYEGKYFKLAIPWKDGAGIYARSNKELSGPGTINGTWKKLCN